MRRVALHGLHQVRNEIVALAQLDIDVGEGLTDPLPHGNEAVIDADEPHHDRDNDTEDDPASGRHVVLPDVSGRPSYPHSHAWRGRKEGICCRTSPHAKRLWNHSGTPCKNRPLCLWRDISKGYG